MDAAKKAEWIKALRSGEYSQTSGMLRNTLVYGGVGYCCLGVLCDLNKADDDQWHGSNFSYKGDDDSSVLPSALMLDLDMTDSNPMCDLSGYRTRTGGYYDRASLAELNDEGFTFDQIADLIEYFV